MALFHQRRLIRQAMREQLLRKTVAEERVLLKTSVDVPWRRQQLPAIAIYAGDEIIDPKSKDTAPRELERTVEVNIEGVIADTGSDSLDDDLDAFELEIEKAMHADPTFSAGGEAKASDSILLRSSRGKVVDGDRVMAAVQLVYGVTYYTPAIDADDVRLDDLKTVDTRTSLGGTVNAGNQAEDKLEHLEA